MRRVEDIESAFRRVKSSAEKAMAGDEASKDQCFQDIFALNNEIGRLARESPGAMRRMKELQACVNSITVGMKYGRTRDLRKGLSVTERAIRALRDELPSTR